MTNTAITHHTSGPWYVTGSSHRDYEGSEIGNGNKTVAVILTADAAGQTEEEAANARLIAAAPELLAACVWMMSELCEAWNEDPETAIPANYRAAVATATQQQDVADKGRRPTYDELLEALEGLTSSLRPWKIAPVLKAAGYAVNTWRAAYRHARATIAKARQ